MADHACRPARNHAGPNDGTPQIEPHPGRLRPQSQTSASSLPDKGSDARRVGIDRAPLWANGTRWKVDRLCSRIVPIETPKPAPLESAPAKAVNSMGRSLLRVGAGVLIGSAVFLGIIFLLIRTLRESEDKFEGQPVHVW